jgi:threonine synthase
MRTGSADYREEFEVCGGAVWAAAKNLAAASVIDPASRVVLFNTGSGFKYL